MRTWHWLRKGGTATWHAWPCLPYEESIMTAACGIRADKADVCQDDPNGPYWSRRRTKCCARCEAAVLRRPSPPKEPRP